MSCEQSELLIIKVQPVNSDGVATDKPYPELVYSWELNQWLEKLRSHSYVMLNLKARDGYDGHMLLCQ